MGDLIFVVTLFVGAGVVAWSVWYSISVENRCRESLGSLNRELQLANNKCQALFDDSKKLAKMEKDFEFQVNSHHSDLVKMDGMRERINNADRRCEELSEEVASLKDKLSQVQSANKILDSTNKKLCLDLDSSRQACGNALDMFKKAEADIKRWQDDCTRYRKVFDSTEENLKKESRYWNQEYQSSRAECEGLKKELEKSRREVENTKKDTDSLRQEMARLHSDYTTLANRMSVIRQYAADAKPVPETPASGSTFTAQCTLEDLQGALACSESDKSILDHLSERLANLVMEKAVNGTPAP